MYSASYIPYVYVHVDTCVNASYLYTNVPDMDRRGGSVGGSIRRRVGLHSRPVLPALTPLNPSKILCAIAGIDCHSEPEGLCILSGWGSVSLRTLGTPIRKRGAPRSRFLVKTEPIHYRGLYN